MNCQKHLFQIPENIHYINCAYMSPLLKAAESAGVAGMKSKRHPWEVSPEDFFSTGHQLRKSFGQIVNSPDTHNALIPAVSYGLMSAIRNVAHSAGQHAISISDEFPSGYFALERWCKDHGAELKIVKRPEGEGPRAAKWNQAILEAINKQTALVLMSSIHWMDGTLFDLAKIGKRCREVGAAFIVDGTQSVGALPIDMEACNIDALVCAGYKWLMGPYSIGMAAYGERFHQGKPIEETWMNRSNAVQFSRLTDYDPVYKPGGIRYEVGQHSHFIHAPMFQVALNQLLDWGIESIQEYCGSLIEPLLTFLESKGAILEDPSYRAKHLLGFQLPQIKDPLDLAAQLRQRQVYVSVRGKSVRISPNVYNDAADITCLMETLDAQIGS